VLLDRINTTCFKDVKTLILLPLILMMGFCISFQAKAWVLLPFGTVVMSIIVGMGTMPLLGWTMTAISDLLPIIDHAIANNYGVSTLSQTR